VTERQHEPDLLDGLRRIGIDEISYRRGQGYLIVGGAWALTPLTRSEARCGKWLTTVSNSGSNLLAVQAPTLKRSPIT
jgi:hypothetical protein